MRLTRKVNNEQLKEAKEFGEPFVREYEKNDYCELEGTCDRDRLNKLGQLEDIEESLGIELTIIGKALLQGDIYVKEVGFVKFHITGDSIYCLGNNRETIFLNLRDYGKTWALTREELE